MNELAQRLLAGAERLTTPCGDGQLVWHAWGQGKPLVLLHGGSGSWNHWIRNVETLAAAGYRVLAADLPGQGDSATPPTGTDADALTQPLEDGLRTLMGDQPVDMAGFSFGGLTSGLLAAEFPHRVARLVIVGAPVVDRGGKRSVRLVPWRDVPEGPERDKILRHNLQQLMLYKPESIDDLAMALHTANVTRDRLPGRRLALQGALGRAMPRIQCAVWGIYGEKDSTFMDQPEAITQQLAQAPKWQGMTTIPEAGHWVQFEQAEAFNAALLKILG